MIIFFLTVPFLANKPKLSNFLFEFLDIQSSIKEQHGPASNANILFKLVLDLLSKYVILEIPPKFIKQIFFSIFLLNNNEILG